MLAKFKLFILFLNILFFLNINANSFEIKTLATVDKSVISNYDLLIEIKLNEIINKAKTPLNKKSLILNNLIDNKIKELEIKKKKIKIDEKIVTDRLIKLVDISQIDQILIDKFIKKIEIELGWQKLIYIKYGNKLDINLKEIEEIKKTKEIKDNDQNLIRIEKNKKLYVASSTYLNKAKNNYLIKIY